MVRALDLYEGAESRRAISIHESGHTIASVRWSDDIYYVTIEHSPHVCDEHIHRHHMTVREKHASYMRMVRVLVAGMAATHIESGKRAPVVFALEGRTTLTMRRAERIGHDYLEAVAVAQFAYPELDHHGLERVLCRQFCMAERHLRAEWPAVQRIARALLRKGRLGREEILRVSGALSGRVLSAPKR